MSQSTSFVGLDVHASQSHAGIFEPVTGELRRRRLNGDPLVVLPFLEQLVGATYPLDRWRDALDHAMAAGTLGTFKVAFAPQA